ncbi:MAG: single-stranded-DNA-specific exonuclease RecJ [Gammaproteobacteria bacterium]
MVQRSLQSPEPDFLAAHHRVLRRIYAARNISSAHELSHKLEHLLPPHALAGLPQAVDLLSDALHEGKRILIVADFDADGATACALAVRALRLLGATDVRYVVPNRFEFGYGLTPEIVAVAARQNPALIITVDNGISSIEGVHAARQLGIQVLITDHHLPGATLPEAHAIVNPNQPGDEFPSKNLAGVGVIFYVMLGLRARLRECGWFALNNLNEPNLGQLLDLVALGTVADVVPLDHNNRILVAQGLARIRQSQCNAGIRALIAIAGRQPDRIAASDLGFIVAPRLNAAGRLEDMSLGIECLLCDDAAAAQLMAERLNELNHERRTIETGMQEQALATLATMELDADKLPSGLCLFNPDWHQGVIGIVASRIKDRLHRPVIAFALSGEDEIKGSARSVTGLHIRDALDSIAARHPRLLSKFGGHAMAAGLSLKLADFAEFSAAFDAEVRRHLSETQMQGMLDSDGALWADEISLELAQVLRSAGPWGQGFPEPVFDGVFEVVSGRLVGSKHLKLMLRHVDDECLIDAIAFNVDTALLTALMPQPPVTASQASVACRKVHIVYRLDVNEYRGARTVQLLVQQIELV